MDPRNESRHGEGESLIDLVLKYGVLNILRGKAEGVPDLNLDPSILFTVANLNNRVR